MSAQLDQIRFEMQEARREGEERKAAADERLKVESRRFWIQTIVTSLAGLAALLAWASHLFGH